MKFRPEITRVKLNPEQAVLSCTCFNGGVNYTGFGSGLKLRMFIGAQHLVCDRWPTADPRTTFPTTLHYDENAEREWELYELSQGMS